MSMADTSLLVDIGNSRLKWQLAGAGDDGKPESLAHGGRLPISLEQQWTAIAQPRRVLVSCVADTGIVAALEELVARLWGIEVRRPAVTRGHRGLVNCYEHPERLGIDRWLAMIGARTLVQGMFCVVDAGTAMTIDVVDADGRHRGGLIMPGLAMMIDSLRAGTSIPDYAEQETPALLGCSTVSGISLGCLQGLGALVDKVIAASGPGEPRLLLTGGDAMRVATVIDHPAEHVPDLVLRGLRTFIEPD
jgi:type III pantothenate kinase